MKRLASLCLEYITIHYELHITVKTANQIFDRRIDSNPALQIREPMAIEIHASADFLLFNAH